MKNETDFIKTLTLCMDKISHTNNKEEITQIFEKLVTKFTESDYATLFIVDEENEALYTYRSTNIPISMKKPKGLLGTTYLNKSVGTYNYVMSELDYLPKIDNRDGLHIISQLLFPIMEEDKLIGIVRASRALGSTETYGQHEKEVLSSLSTFIMKIIHILTSKSEGHTIDTDATLEEIRKIKKSNEKELDETLMFFSNAVHDIRTPANSLYGFLELLEEQMEDETLKVFVSNAKESAKFINELTTSILDQAKQRHELKQTVSLPVSINTIPFFTKTANIFTSNMSDKGIHYTIYLDPKLPKEIKIDKVKLKRIIINLVGNAYKFTPKNKQIEFKVIFDEVNYKLNISIADQGIGIDEARQKSIFEAFEQAEDDTSVKYGGTGLGLAISASYVKELGGELQLDSKPEEGSRFYFSIPIEMVNSNQSYMPFEESDKHITILTDHVDSADSENIQHYLINYGIPQSKITISNRIDDKSTHIICFQHKLSDRVLTLIQERPIKLLLLEESLFSLLKDDRFKGLNIASLNSYYGDILYEVVRSGRKRRVLIADDNKINLTLLQHMLIKEYLDIQTVLDGAAALDALKDAHQEGHNFDIVFMDKNMPHMSGSEVMKAFRAFEKEAGLSPIFAISITGDPELEKEEQTLYDLLVQKPFNKRTVIEALRH